MMQHRVRIVASPNDDDQTSIEVILEASHTKIKAGKEPNLVQLDIFDADELEDVTINSEIMDVINNRIKELEMEGEDEEDIAEGMRFVIEDLLSQWTLPDDRAEMLGNEKQEVPKYKVGIDLATGAEDKKSYTGVARSMMDIPLVAARTGTGKSMLDPTRIPSRPSADFEREYSREFESEYMGEVVYDFESPERERPPVGHMYMDPRTGKTYVHKGDGIWSKITSSTPEIPLSDVTERRYDILDKWSKIVK
jgi:hypothetical protein